MVIRWICNHPIAYQYITGVVYTLPYGVAAWVFYVQGLLVPLWIALTMGVAYNALWTWMRVLVSKPARRMDREQASDQNLTRYRSAVQAGTRRSQATYRTHADG